MDNIRDVARADEMKKARVPLRLHRSKYCCWQTDTRKEVDHNIPFPSKP